MISYDSLCSSLKNSDDVEFFEILRNETHLQLPIETVTPLTVSTSQDIISGRREKSCSKWKSLSLRMTVEVEIDSWWAMSVIEVFSISFWAILENSSSHTSCFKVRNLRRFLKVIFLHLTSTIRTRWSLIIQFSDDFFVSIPINNIHKVDIMVFNV